MSTAIQHLESISENPDSRQTVSSESRAIVVVGAGPVGMQFVDELARRNVDVSVVVYGSEPDRPYNRVRLSDYLAGEMYRDALHLEETRSDLTTIEYRYNCPVEWIDRNAGTITDATGRVQQYSELILATGSSPYIPVIGNSNYKGVYTFRTLGEADELLSRKIRTRHTVVLGGGLLGLETARAMQKYHTEISIVEHNSWLMMQQLDEQGARQLEHYIKSTGIRVILGDSIISIEGKDRVEAIQLRSGIRLKCDTLIIAAGIRPNTSLALDAGIACNRGIRINDRCETSETHIYAIGECAEHDNIVYGLVQPGFEQAAVLAERLAGRDAQYKGSTSATQLKIMSIPVFSAGRNGNNEDSAAVKEYIFSDRENSVYRKIRIYGNRIVGAVAVGTWHESALINETILNKRKLWFWQLVRFKTSGNIWGDPDSLSIDNWPASATVCNCTGVTRGRLSHAVNSGCENVACLTTMTRAGGVCGSCKPLLAEMLGKEMTSGPVRLWRSLLGFSALSLCIAALFVFIWRVPYADSVQHSIRWDMLWRDSLLKQTSGFTILGLFAIGLSLSLRKRFTRFNYGNYDMWRMVHVVLGIASLAALAIHTGFRLGNELNFLLTTNFLLLAAAGANASTIVATEHRMVPALAKKQRNRWNWLHLVLFWPLPTLLGFHIFKTYYF